MKSMRNAGRRPPQTQSLKFLKRKRKKRFGLFGGRPAKVRAFIRSTPADAAAEYLRNVLSGMGLGDVNIEIREEEAGAELCAHRRKYRLYHRPPRRNAGFLQYLALSLQTMWTSLIIALRWTWAITAKSAKETLENLGRKMAARAVKTGRNASLEPMNPYERRIIHTAVQEVEGAKSWSEGEDLARHVVIGPEGRRALRKTR